MTAIAYPVAETAEQALHTPLGFAVREREAATLAGGAGVAFVSESVGPAFVSEAAAMAAYAGSASAPGEWKTLRPVLEGTRPGRPRKPVNKAGKRWPEPKPPTAPTQWRLSVSYWRIVRAAEAAPLSEPARKLRRDPTAEGLGPRALQALALQPLRAAKPQQPLDIGLFEVRLPEAPDRTIPDE